MTHSPDSARTKSAKLAVERLEDRTTPTFSPNAFGSQFSINGTLTQTGVGLSIAAGDLFPDIGDTATSVKNEVVFGTGDGHIQVYSNTGTLLTSFTPFPGFGG